MEELRCVSSQLSNCVNIWECYHCNMPEHKHIANLKGCLIAATVVACATQAPSVAATTIEIPNFDEVAPHILRGACPDKEDIPQLKKMGVQTILDLRMHHSFGEERLAKLHGIRWVHVPLGYWAPSDKKIRQAMDVLRDPSQGKVFVHCDQGADRTGTIVALYRVLVEGWTFQHAYSEMRAHHFKPWWLALRERVETYSDRKQSMELAVEPQKDVQARLLP